jgi:hypothetical protein
MNGWTVGYVLCVAAYVAAQTRTRRSGVAISLGRRGSSREESGVPSESDDPFAEASMKLYDAIDALIALGEAEEDVRQMVERRLNENREG